MIFAMIPGDARQEALGELLRRDGHETPVWKPGLRADWYLFPLPTGADPRLGELPAGSRVLAGAVRGQWPELDIRDYFAGEPVQVLNAVLTAEGAVGEAIRASRRSLWGGRALVTGYGRIARCLCPRLRAMGCRVTVWARREESRAWAEAEGYGTLDSLEEAVGFDYLFNTVPAPILPGAPRGTLCLELASRPGGFRDDAGVLPCQGLPGRTAPETAAKVLKASIDRIVKEENAI